jgi:protein gp37
MADSTSIEWTDATWNPVTGCTKITPGCEHCYAERFSERFRGVPGHAFQNGFDLTLRPERLTQPLHWRQPRRIFVNSMSDLFHKQISSSFIDRVFDTMEAANWHTFQILTKRSSLMARYLQKRYGSTGLAPLHIWLGVSVEDAKNTVRLKHLRTARASVKFVSFEPLLAPVGKIDLTGIHWAIVGGESGPKERKHENKTGTSDLFAGLDADVQELSIDDIVEEQKILAKNDLMEMLKDFSLEFNLVWTTLLQAHMLRLTNVKDICVELAKTGKIQNTWGGGNRKPRDLDVIKLSSSP